MEERLATLGAVERRVELVRAQQHHDAERIIHPDDDVRVALEQRHQVGLRLLDQVDLAGVERRDRRRRVRQVVPLDAVDLDDLASGQHVGGLGPRRVVLVLLVDHLVAGHPLLAHESERTGADGDVDLRRRVGLRHRLRHHEGRIGAELGQHRDQQPELLLELPGEGALVDDGEIGGQAHRRAALVVARRPAADRLHAVGGRHRLAVVPLEPGTQREGVGQRIVADGVALQHLRPGDELRVQREQRVEDHRAVIERDVRGTPDRIDDLEIRMRHELQRALRRRRQRQR